MTSETELARQKAEASRSTKCEIDAQTVRAHIDNYAIRKGSKMIIQTLNASRDGVCDVFVDCGRRLWTVKAAEK